MKTRILLLFVLASLSFQLLSGSTYTKVVHKYAKTLTLKDSDYKSYDLTFKAIEINDSIKACLIYIDKGQYEKTINYLPAGLEIPLSEIKVLIQDLEEFGKIYTTPIPSNYTQYSWEFTKSKDRANYTLFISSEGFWKFCFDIHNDTGNIDNIIRSYNFYHNFHTMNQILAALKEAVASFDK